ncbi:hypothetical protein HPP92_021456 [Vanilla planifolia]|uniref:Tubby-like F-box protein n=1 Tax=Vanilla planifolia TaxID=51239 RepID=A0A835PYW9_VANPL|nr:hypothetical protein HPP92_021456 [Vanilla planifolia]
MVHETKGMRDSRGPSKQHQQLPPLEEEEEEIDDRKKNGKWEVLPPELLFDILKRVETAQTSWPARRNVVACTAICRSWRQIMKEVVKPPEKSGLLTFPISLKQPAPRDPPIQCFIRRETSTSTYRLYYGLSPSLQEKNDKLLLAARRIWRASGAHFVISSAADDFSRASSTYVGKLKSNFVGTKFTLYDSQPSSNSSVASSSKSNRRFHAKQVSPKVAVGNYNIASIVYEVNVLRGRGPRRMMVSMHSIPASSLVWGETNTLHSFDEHCPASSSKNGKEPLVAISPKGSSAATCVEPLVLKNKAPRWHEQLQCWCLNFRGRVTVASVKNFQLVAVTDPSRPVPSDDQEKGVILQFGKIGKNVFTMDYRYPLSAFQAFAICLSSFDTKPACE